MIYLDLIFNLALLVALSVISGFIDRRWPRNTRTGVLLQGTLFGGAALLGMLHPLNLGPGLIFDGRSVMLSLCALFFGPWAATIACFMTMAYRIALGGMGVTMGVSVILASTIIGLAAHYRFKPSLIAPSIIQLYGLGLVVHLVMVALMYTLPQGVSLSTFQRLGLPILLMYPVATILAGAILTDHLSTTQAAAALNESEERYRILFNNSLDAILLTDPDGRIHAANTAACHLFGRSEEEIKTGGRNSIIDNRDPRLAEALEERSRTGKFAGVLTFVRKDGSTFPGEVSTVIFQDHHHQPRTSMIIRDVTERERMEMKLRESEVHFRTLADSGQALIWTSDLDKEYNYFNQTWLAFTGRTLEQEVGDGWVAGVHPEDVQSCTDIYKSAFDRRVIFSMNYRLRRFDGEYRWIQDNGTPRFSSRGEFIGYIGHCLDITDHKKAEKKIRKLNDELEQKVQERTAELKQTIAQLEETNRVFVGRELKMAELKNRIKELEKQ